MTCKSVRTEGVNYSDLASLPSPADRSEILTLSFSLTLDQSEHQLSSPYPALSVCCLSHPSNPLLPSHKFENIPNDKAPQLPPALCGETPSTLY